jgi:UDP-glucose 4-epimerase
VEALLRLKRSAAAVGEVVNVGSEEQISILELAHRVVALMNSSSAIEPVAYEVALAPGFEDMRNRRPSIAKLWRLTGFRPLHRLDEIIGLMAGQPIKKGAPQGAP